MRKIVALAVGAALVCTLLAGCGGGKKIPPENFPHSETLRLDATPEEIIAAENLVFPDYDQTTSKLVYTTIDGVKFRTHFYFSSKWPELLVGYLSSEETKDATKEYDHFVKYFSALYGQGTDAAADFGTPSKDLIQTFQATKWSYSLDGQNFKITLREFLLPDINLHQIDITIDKAL